MQIRTGFFDAYCVCMYVYVHADTYIHVYCTSTISQDTYVHVHVCTPVRYTCTYTETKYCTNTHIHICTHMHTCTHARMHTYPTQIGYCISYQSLDQVANLSYTQPAFNVSSDWQYLTEALATSETHTKCSQ